MQIKPLLGFWWHFTKSNKMNGHFIFWMRTVIIWVTHSSRCCFNWKSAPWWYKNSADLKIDFLYFTFFFFWSYFKIIIIISEINWVNTKSILNVKMYSQLKAEPLYQQLLPVTTLSLLRHCEVRKAIILFI